MRVPTRARARRYCRGAYQALSISARSSSLVGRVGRQLRARRGPGSRRPRRRGARGRRRAPTAAARPPPSSSIRSASSARFVPSARASAVICLRRAGSAPRATRGSIAALVSACGIRSTRTSVWQITWWRREQRRVERVGAEDRAERELRRVALGALGVERRRDQARRRAARPSRRPGWRAACRASRRRGRARSSRWRAAAASGRPTISGGSAITSCGPHEPCGASWPSGSRWIAVISAPESVVGIAATRPPRTAAIAFAESITRPPPSATRSPAPTSSKQLARRPR